MPDECPGADQHEHEVDELAQGLVGLPIRLWGWRVDSSGFHRRAGILRRKRDVPWRNIKAVYREGLWLAVEGTRPGRSPGRLLESYGRLAALRAVVAAWNEYADRKIERDGRFEAQWSAAPLRLRAIPIAWGLILVGLAIFVALSPPGPRVYLSMRYGRVVEQPTRLRMATFWLAVSTFGLGGIGLCCHGIFHLRRAWLLGCRWARWELSPDGLVFWPGGEKRILKPAPGDTLTPSEASIGGERVPLRHMAYPLASQILFAMGERHGAALRRSRSLWLVPGLLFVGPVSLGFTFLEGGSWDERLGPLLFVFAGVAIERAVRAGVPGRMLFHGRAMLERLGW